MNMSRLNELSCLGQSVWLDFISRSFLLSGQLEDLVGKGLRGMTSNPAIFEKAIAGSSDYDADIRRLTARGLGADEVYEALALDDIAMAADALLPVYEASGGIDGYVSLEVSPFLACDTAGTVDAALKLSGRLGRPNVMIKIPATREGMPAIEAVIACGISVNVTLIFSVEQYEEAAYAYMSGLERLRDEGGDCRRVASVASVFVSRVDSAVDPLLQSRGRHDLVGTTALDNARAVYLRFRELCATDRWAGLAECGARVQRPLWASTGTKNALFEDTLYVDNLIGRDTVNTLPMNTLQAFLDHGVAQDTLGGNLSRALERRAQLAQMGIDLGAVTGKLLEEGLAAFESPYRDLIYSISAKQTRYETENREGR
jgi:transaldolase